ncbi:uncharacterized protein CLUP02_16627 [Colletotrichum lupini]|uniref:Uncharacterized protein n=1 Tax=Colletotrichum lupini TaxID=145971 RepID=A0A9Q8T8A5_9PEZI|nr:uncharacterized protein CLUP02_16627 [Colletotrichum lupini]UQC91093.1 hypothetical protein CLUP02_16627 [Colletotrichum lupini]
MGIQVFDIPAFTLGMPSATMYDRTHWKSRDFLPFGLSILAQHRAVDFLGTGPTAIVDARGLDARSFNPDRWLKPNAKSLEQYQVAFSKGARIIVPAKITCVLTLLFRKYAVTLACDFRPPRKFNAMNSSNSILYGFGRFTSSTLRHRNSLEDRGDKLENDDIIRSLADMIVEELTIATGSEDLKGGFPQLQHVYIFGLRIDCTEDCPSALCLAYLCLSIWESSEVSSMSMTVLYAALAVACLVVGAQSAQQCFPRPLSHKKKEGTASLDDMTAFFGLWEEMIVNWYLQVYQNHHPLAH